MNPTEQRFQELEAAVEVLETLVGRLMPENKPVDDIYGDDAEAWVDGWLLPRLERQITTGGTGICWCARWRAHPEAVARFETLHDAWNEARVGTAGAMAGWFLEKLDPTFRVLTAPDGPFARCRERHRLLAPLPSEPDHQEVDR
jgi:hypothetical protein